MPHSSKIKVNPALLVWARETIGVDIPDVAKRFGVKEKLVSEWESGKQPLTYNRLEGLADFYKRPIAVFFLPEAPVESATPTDFRLLPNEKVSLSKDLRLAVRQARFIRNAYREIKPDYKKVERGILKLSQNPEKAAWEIRQKLDLAFDRQKVWKVGKHALENFVKILEDQGVIILQYSFPENEVSGFSLGEEGKPAVIVLNSQDAYFRRIFTLFHEYCHLLLDESGICKLEYDSTSFERNHGAESFCDKFASEILVPNRIFKGRSEIGDIMGRNEDENAIRKLSNAFKVSKQVILLKLLHGGFISQDYYNEKKKKFDNEYREYIKKKKEREKNSEGGPQPFYIALSERGKLFSKTALDAFKNGRISNRDVAGYLGVKLRYLPTIESLL